MGRQAELLGKIADKFDDLNYVDGNFAVENDVSIDDLSSTMKAAANILRGYLELPESEQYKLQMLGAGVPPEVVESVGDSMRMKETLAKLKDHGKEVDKDRGRTGDSQ